MKKNINLNKGGFTLIETLVAVSIFSISILGILSVIATSITNTTYAKNKMTAGYLAAEGIEYVRNIRDDNAVIYAVNGGALTWGTFKGKMASCVKDSACGFDSTSANTNTISFFNCPSDPTGINCNLYVKNGSYIDNIGNGNPSGFTRKVWMATTNNPDEVIIFSAAYWNQGSGSYNITFSENLFNWTQS